MRRRAPRRVALRTDDRINVGLPHEMYADLVAEATDENVPLSVIVRLAIAYYQDHHPRPAEAAS